ncbi:MAG: tyrosine-type recombinase/integrase [Nitrospinae bacterium]|nr:tyrosine-type recombinase/integrase [Nitrospinota bacterium]
MLEAESWMLNIKMKEKMKEEQINRVKLLIQRFREYMGMENFSQRTIGDYVNQLGFFIQYLQTTDIEEITQIDKELIHKYQMYLYSYQKKGKPLSLETQYARLVPVKSLFRFLVKRGYFLYDPTSQIELPKRKKNLPRGLMTKKEIFKILSQPDPDTILGLRDKAILELLYSTGIRNSELRNLSIYDLDTTHGELRINYGKGRKDRVIPLGEIASKYIEEYLNISRPLLLEQQKQKSQNLLFVSKRGKKIDQSNLIWLIKKYVKKANVHKHITPHSFRHTCATHMLRGKANLRHIQELLGHSSIATTQIYTQVELSDLKREHRRSHPREKQLDAES